jgi:transcriptional regulator with XRE-family HTH domain
VATSSPTVRQRELGKRLRELRNQHDLTVEDVAEKLLCSATKISRLETAARRPSLRDVRDLCALYGVNESTTAELMSLARGAREQGWWTQYEDLKLDPYLGLEQVATGITSYTMYYIPALLQTKEYTNEIIKTIAPKMDLNVLQQRIEVRMRRQERLEDDDRPSYNVLLDEAVLHRSVGGPTIMAAQLQKVLDAVRNRKVTVQVVPFNAGAHAAQDSNFILFEFKKRPDPSPVVGESSDPSPVVFVEGLTGNQYLEKLADIVRYSEALEYLRKAALSPRASVELVTEKQDVYAKLANQLA